MNQEASLSLGGLRFLCKNSMLSKAISLHGPALVLLFSVFVNAFLMLHWFMTLNLLLSLF